MRARAIRRRAAILNNMGAPLSQETGLHEEPRSSTVVR